MADDSSALVIKLSWTKIVSPYVRHNTDWRSPNRPEHRWRIHPPQKIRARHKYDK